MNTVEELNQIKIANMIINRSSQRLGVKPVYVGSLINTQPKKKPIDELKVVAQKLSQEKFLKRKAKKFKLKNLRVIFYALVAVAIIYALVFVFRPAQVNSGIQPESQSNIKLDESSTGIFKKTGGMVITSGSFKTLAEAESFKDKLSEKLGVPLEILHDAKYFTVQIGPSYENHADAMIVFDELSRYSIGGLALRRVG